MRQRPRPLTFVVPSTRTPTIVLAELSRASNVGDDTHAASVSNVTHWASSPKDPFKDRPATRRRHGAPR